MRGLEGTMRQLDKTIRRLDMRGLEEMTEMRGRVKLRKRVTKMMEKESAAMRCLDHHHCYRLQGEIRLPYPGVQNLQLLGCHPLSHGSSDNEASDCRSRLEGQSVS
jgi:hypothetical protein